MRTVWLIEGNSRVAREYVRALAGGGPQYDLELFHSIAETARLPVVLPDVALIDCASICPAESHWITGRPRTFATLCFWLELRACRFVGLLGNGNEHEIAFHRDLRRQFAGRRIALLEHGRPDDWLAAMRAAFPARRKEAVR